MSWKTEFDAGVTVGFSTALFGETISVTRVTASGSTTASTTGIFSFLPPGGNDEPVNSDPGDPFRWSFCEDENVSQDVVAQVMVVGSNYPSTGQFANATTPLAGDQITYSSVTYVVSEVNRDDTLYVLTLTGA